MAVDEGASEEVEVETVGVEAEEEGAEAMEDSEIRSAVKIIRLTHLPATKR